MKSFLQLYEGLQLSINNYIKNGEINMSEKKNLIKVNAFLTEEQISELKEYGEAMDLTLSWLIRAAVRSYITNKINPQKRAG